MRRTLFASLILLGTLPGGLSAQRTLCFNGSRLPVCSNFLIVEMQGALPVAQTSRTVTYRPTQGLEQPTETELFESRLQWELGMMHNVNEKWAVGGAAGLGTGSSDPFTSLVARGRRWLGPDVGLDLSAGVIFRGPNGMERRAGLVTDARLNFNDDVYAGVRFERLRVDPIEGEFFTDEGGTQHAVELLLGTGSEWTLAGSTALATWLLVALATVDWS